jgi:hypothetical protein
VDSCIASTHLFHLRTSRDAAASLFGDRRGLPRVDGLRFSRLVFVGGRGTEGFAIGTVDPRRQLAFCIWEDAAALERFERGSPIARRWREASDEYCELRMRPFRAHGSYFGERPLTDVHSLRDRGGYRRVAVSQPLRRPLRRIRSQSAQRSIATIVRRPR